jgi:hypothetical protein
MSGGEAVVECHSGYTYPQEPRAVIWEGCRHRVERIDRRWRTPEGPGFRVKAEAGIWFDVHYHEFEDHWSVQVVGTDQARAP